jgi:hypothetical protein
MLLKDSKRNRNDLDQYQWIAASEITLQQLSANHISFQPFIMRGLKLTQDRTASVLVSHAMIHQ